MVDELRKHAASFQLLTYPSPEQVLARANTFSRPVAFSIPLENLDVPEAEAREIDATVFRAPQEMVEASDLRWLQRELWPVLASIDT